MLAYITNHKNKWITANLLIVKTLEMLTTKKHTLLLNPGNHVYVSESLNFDFTQFRFVSSDKFNFETLFQL